MGSVLEYLFFHVPFLRFGKLLKLRIRLKQHSRRFPEEEATVIILYISRWLHKDGGHFLRCVNDLKAQALQIPTSTTVLHARSLAFRQSRPRPWAASRQHNLRYFSNSRFRQREAEASRQAGDADQPLIDRTRFEDLQRRRRGCRGYQVRFYHFQRLALALWHG